MLTAGDMCREVYESLPGHEADYDVHGAVEEIIATYGRISIEDIDHDEYWQLVSRHDRATPETYARYT